ncbi:MAG: cell division ATP-binding protein FtsE [Gemmatimonadota bacterium]|nr:cell division ATP-binding protein FtsE [Gemmatimonadota bacterium]
MIRFSHVHKSFARTGAALQDVSFQLNKGEFVFITGPSGAGKSTILKLCFFEEMPSKGEVKVYGTSSATYRPGDVPKLRRRLGVVFQDFRLLEDRNVESNIAFALEVTGTPPAQIGPRVARLLAQVGLAAKATSLPRELSGGEQQRVAIARALANDPVALIADEPTGNLDERATRGIYQLFRDINASGTAVLMATHDLDLVRRSGCRTIEVNRGQVVFDSAADGGFRASGASAAVEDDA